MAILSALLLFLAITAAVHSQSCENADAEVLILGAGMSGISAAKTLYDNGVTDFIILEQASRVGGRIRSTEFAGTVIEVGAQWIFHGTDPTDETNPGNIVYQLARQCGVELRPDPVFSRGSITYDRNGVDISERLPPVFVRYLAALDDALQLGERFNEQDPEETIHFSVEVALRLAGWIPRTPEEQFTEWFFFELGSTVLPTDTVSFRRIFGRNRDLIPSISLVTDQRGYAYIPECLAEEFLSPNGSRLHLNTQVTAIQWSDECVCASALENGESRQYCAPYAIHTFSHGTVQFGTVQFEPALPETKTFAFNLFNEAVFLKIWISFNETFWDTDVDNINYIDPILGREYYPLISPLGASYPGNPPILETFLSGETALRVALQDPEITKQQIVDVLRRIYGDRVTEPVDILVHDFATNPFFYGNLDIPLVGANTQTYETIAAPLGRLYFSGSGTRTFLSANTVGAYYSGIVTSNDILEDIREGLPLGAEFINDSPRVVGNSVEADFIITGPVTSVTCSLPGGNRQECSSGTVTFTDLAPGTYTLRVIVRSIRERVVQRGRFVIPTDE